MVRVHIICEGQTEETFVKDLLAPHFLPMEIYLSPSLIGKPGHKGGTIKFDRLFLDARNRLLGDTTAYCTTFFDFYALPTDFPGKEAAGEHIAIKDKATTLCEHLTNSLQDKLGENAMRRFIPYVQMYEFEALLFSDSKSFAKGIDRSHLASDFQEIRDSFDSPEEINDSPITAPSKRVIELVSGYEKPLYGTLAALEIGLKTMRRECKLFDAWLKKLEALKTEAS